MFERSFPAWRESAALALVAKRSAATLGIVLGLATMAATANASCQYVITNEWDTGFTGAIRVTNSGTAAVTGWNVAWQYAGGDRITSSWNATLTGTNPYAATNLNWNGALGVGQTVEFGFQGNKGGTTAEKPPITGSICGGSNSSVSVSSSSIKSSSSSVVSSKSSSSSSVVSSSIKSSSSSSVPRSSSSIISSIRSSSSVATSSSIVSSSVKSSSSSSIRSSSSSSIKSSSSSVTSSVSGGGDWLHIDKNKIVDANGKAVWLTGVNWFGFNTSERVFHGLWSAHFPTMMKSIADHGINTLRVPISVELILEWKAGVYKDVNVNTYANPELTGLNSLQIFDRTLELANANGIKVLLDMHSAEADNSGHVYPLWTHGKFTEEDFYTAWTWMATRYKNNDTMVAYDLKNEPHGKAFQETEFAIWDNSSASNNWKRVAQEAASRILAINPNVLIMIEGIESYPKPGVPWTSRDVHEYYNTWWGGNLRGVTDYPVVVSGHQNQIMYSPHDYGPSVYEQPWFYDGFTMDTLIKDAWYDNWLYIHDKGISPLLIGEWGGFMDGGKNQAWMTHLRNLMIQKKIHHTFWCLNPNSGDTGGLLGYDWATWDDAKYSLVKPSLWQLSGKFVGLDHDTPLGASGLSLNQYYSSGGAEPIGN